MNKKQIFYRLFKLAYTNGWEPQDNGINKMLSNLESEVESFLIFNGDGTIYFKGEPISLIEALTDFELDRQCSLYYLIKNVNFDGFYSYDKENKDSPLDYLLNLKNPNKITFDIIFSFKKTLFSTPKSQQLDLFLNAFKHLLIK